MGLYKKIDKQIDKYYEVVLKNQSLSKQNFCLKFLVLFFYFFKVFMSFKEKLITMEFFL